MKYILIIHILFSFTIFAQDSTLTNDTGNVNDTVFVMHKSPWGAVLRSAIIPGWGQIYNESYIKAPVIWGISAWLVYNWLGNNKDYKHYKDLYLQDPTGRLAKNYQSLRNFYRDQRDLFTIYLSLTYVLNLVDAYVDAHLFDFSVEENKLTRTPMLNLKLRLQ